MIVLFIDKKFFVQQERLYNYCVKRLFLLRGRRGRSIKGMRQPGPLIPNPKVHITHTISDVVTFSTTTRLSGATIWNNTKNFIDRHVSPIVYIATDEKDKRESSRILGVESIS